MDVAWSGAHNESHEEKTMEMDFFRDLLLVAEALVFCSNKNSLACLSFLICNSLKFDGVY